MLLKLELNENPTQTVHLDEAKKTETISLFEDDKIIESIFEDRISDFMNKMDTDQQGFNYLTNCIDIREVKFIFLADIHDFKPVKDFNSKIIDRLCGRGTTVFVENDDEVGNCLATANRMLCVENLSSDIDYRGWDLRTDSSGLNEDFFSRYFYLLDEINFFIDDLNLIINQKSDQSYKELNKQLDMFFSELTAEYDNLNMKLKNLVKIIIDSSTLDLCGSIFKIIIICLTIIDSSSNLIHGAGFDSRQNKMIETLDIVI